MSTSIRCLYLFVMALMLLVHSLVSTPSARAFDDEATSSRTIDIGSIEEIRTSKLAMLVASRSYELSAGDRDRRNMEIAYESIAKRKFFHIPVFFQIARDLNRYVKKFRSISAVTDRRDADFFIVFLVYEERRSMLTGENIIRGQLFVIKRAPDEHSNPRLVWMSKDDLTRPESAIRAFIKDLRSVRGER